MAEKDNWDKFNIISSFLSSVILVLVPIVIKLGADSIAQSLERGKLIDSLIEDLTERKTQARRDIAIVALDAAMPLEKKCTVLWAWGCKTKEDEPDLVTDVAVILLKDITTIGQSLGQEDLNRINIESTTAADILRKRRPGTSREILSRIARDAETTSSANPNMKPEQSEIERKEEISKIIANILPPPESKSTNENLAGVRLVYVQYQSNRKRAEELQKYLQSKGISTPGIEQIQGINQNDIRYPSVADKQIAERLKANLEQNKGIKFEQLVDLSTAGYRVPSGQFEIWLKDQ